MSLILDLTGYSMHFCIFLQFPRFQIRFAGFISCEFPSVNFTFITFFNFAFLSSIWSVSLVFPIKVSSVTDNRSSYAFKLHISSSVQYSGFVSVGLFFCVSFVSLSHRLYVVFLDYAVFVEVVSWVLSFLLCIVTCVLSRFSLQGCIRI